MHDDTITPFTNLKNVDIGGWSDFSENEEEDADEGLQVFKSRRRPPLFRRRREIGYYSVNRNGDMLMDRSSLKYLYDKNVGESVNLKLKVAYSEFNKCHEPSIADFELFLKWFDSFSDKSERLVF